MDNKPRHFLLLLGLMALSWLLQSIPLPAWLRDFMPLWSVILFAYWLMFYCSGFALLSAFFAGLLVDVLFADILGQNALAFVVMSGFLLKIKQSFMAAGMMGQQGFIFLASLIYTLFHSAVYIVAYDLIVPWTNFMPAFSSALVWLFVGLSKR